MQVAGPRGRGSLLFIRASRMHDGASVLPLHQSEYREPSAPRQAAIGPPSLLECIAWGSVAECAVALCCPLVMVGSVDLTASALNVVGPLLSGMAQAMDEAAGVDPSVHRACVAFQTGFIGVATSFSFMADQAARLGAGAGWLYIVATMAAGCVAFGMGRVAMEVALRLQRVRRLVINQCAAGVSAAPAAERRRVRMLVLAVSAMWVWVLLAPPGAVHDPLAVHGALGRGYVGASSAQLAHGDDASALAIAVAPASKRADCLHLLCGLGMQALGLAASARLGAAQLDSREDIHWGSLVCNACACALLLVLRAAEAAGSSLLGSALLATKLRTSGCGALSISGGLALVFGGSSARRSKHHSATACALVNCALHTYVAAATCVLLPRLTAWASDS